ncbi:hypothetical protein N7462_001726 [Penicillium macrosclerotiorum]|uniref:uncharacterized protein n=1 Tax=Penicillium macrosclerotiorum TaxID=303699 RepID=UPI002547FC5E|nr:uncharacterized protein N7462_001726 [Penicillium macrosclerotiorum]KAJ5692303.1 hypothetical protein N7462_001726 [Penicillium macrosclerotiorum]
MARRLASRVVGYTTLATAATAYGVHCGLSYLEEKYPNLSPHSVTSADLTRPHIPNQQRVAYTDIFAARIPVAALKVRARCTDRDTQTSLENIWARSILGGRILSTEASVIGFLTTGKYQPGDVGDDGFAADSRSPQKLLHGVATTQQAPGIDREGYGLLISWIMSDEPRLFFEKIARWGYPWRLMSGGRHEMSVSRPYTVDGQCDFVDVRFASAHDYEIIESEGPDGQKIIPMWVMRLHAGYARLILDTAVREVLQDYQTSRQ